MTLLDILQGIARPKLWHDEQRYRKSIIGRSQLEPGSSAGNRPRAACLTLGATASGRPLRVALDDINGHGLIAGATGASKTWTATSIVQQLAQSARTVQAPTPAVVDEKGDLFDRVLAVLRTTNRWPAPLVMNFASRQPVPYALLKPRANETADQLVERRMATFDDAIGREGQLTLRMSRALRHALAVAVEHQVAFPLVEFLLQRPDLLRALGTRSRHERTAAYFETEFDRERNITIPALLARLDFLLRSEVLRLSFGSNEVQDFGAAMDAARPVVINTGGPTVSRQLSTVVRSIVVSDVRAGIFARRERHPYVWLLDEMQNLLSNPSDVEALVTILTMARSFSVGVTMLTQSLVAASPSADFLNQLEANLRWLVMFRTGPDDARLLHHGLHVSGNVLRHRDTSGRVSYMTESEERQRQYRNIAALPNHEAYVWIRTGSAGAVRVRLPRVVLADSTTTVCEPSWIDENAVRGELREQERRLLEMAAHWEGSRTRTKSARRDLSAVLKRLDAVTESRGYVKR